MILNTYAILDGFLTLLRLGLALSVVGLGVSAWRGWRRAGADDARAADARSALEDRAYLLFLLGALLLLLNVVSWPLLYLVLDSYVPEWPGVMCIYGVTQIGSGSEGPSRFLPGLLQGLQVLKPALVFVSGAWAVLYVVNRRTAHAPLTGRVLLVLIGAALLAVLDAATEAAYLAIPKKESFLSAGCCTVVSPEQAERFLPAALVHESARPALSAAYFIVNGVMIAGLLMTLRTLPRRLATGMMAFLVVVNVLAVAVSGVFLVEVAAPALLNLPHHHCVYDLVPQAPEALLAAGSFVAGVFAVGWAGMATWLGRCSESAPFLAQQVRRLLVIALFAFSGSLVMTAVELALA